jgi:polar amino acid transport system ATP-binding protein
MLKVHSLSKSINGQKILDNISFKIQKGEIIAIIGPSGGGKSTLLRSIALMEHLDSGIITIDDQVFNFPLTLDQKLPLVYPKITMVFQQLFLWPHLTVLWNITLAAGESLDQILLDELVQTFGIQNILNKYPNEISGGQKQRVALIRALILKPDYLLLDEITSALDTILSKSVLKYVSKAASQGTGVLIVTHNVELIPDLARIVSLNNGKLITSSTPPKLSW